MLAPVGIYPLGDPEIFDPVSESPLEVDGSPIQAMPVMAARTSTTTGPNVCAITRSP